MRKFLYKKGYYSFYQDKNKIIVDSGKTILFPKINKIVINPYRDEKEFNTTDEANRYVYIKLQKQKKIKEKKLKQLPTSLYLIIMKEDASKKLFIKVGITTKKIILRRFSKDYGYEGYKISKILRKIVTSHSNAELLESKILNELNKKWPIKKYRPLLENFSGYSECYDYLYLEQIINIFDKIVLKYKNND